MHCGQAALVFINFLRRRRSCNPKSNPEMLQGAGTTGFAWVHGSPIEL